MQDNSLNPKSKEYYIITTLREQIKTADDENLRNTYDRGNLVYLDDDMTTLRAFIGILENMVESSHDDAPAHLIGELRKMEVQDIKNILRDHDILLYGRSGMRLNSPVLQDI